MARTTFYRLRNEKPEFVAFDVNRRTGGAGDQFPGNRTFPAPIGPESKTIEFMLAS
jgi:hypothetical protein